MKKYSEETKDRVIGDYLENNTPISELSIIYKIDRRRIGEWIRKANVHVNGVRVIDDNKVDLVKVKIDNNIVNKAELEKSVSSTSKEEQSIDDILSKNGLSKNEWEITNVSINNWEDSKGQKHYQTKLNLVKKQISLDLEIPAPIKITVDAKTSPKFSNKNGLRCAVILPDMQVGFRRNLNNGSLTAIHDREAMNIAMNIVEYLGPDRVVLLGDNLDLAELSTKYTTPPDMMYTTQASVVELGWWLGKLRGVSGDAKIDFIGGNHDERLNRFISEKASMLAGLKQANNLNGNPILSIQNLLDLDTLNISYHNYPQGMVALNSNLVCVHGEVAKGMSGATVSELVKSARVSIIQGHIHRHEVATKTVWDAYDNYHIYTAASFGCLCRIDPGYVPGMKYRQNWQNGIGIVWYEEGGLEQFQMEFIPIIAGRAIYDGQIFESIGEDEIALNIEKQTRYRLS